MGVEAIVSAIGAVVRRSLQRPVGEGGGDCDLTARSSVAGRDGAKGAEVPL